ncbi:MAG: MarR family transcriptional regulator [Firmicutes bacterium]|nr:MarR family transcriptional regulator [Bacillota bacterium]
MTESEKDQKYYAEFFRLVGDYRGLHNRLLFPKEIENELPFFKCDFSGIELNIISAINRYGPASMTELTNNVAFPKSSVSRIVETLVKKEFVKRYHEKNNRKTVYVAFTDKGEKLCADEDNIYGSFFIKKIKSVLDEGERAKLLECFRFIIDIVSKILD